jgi:signal peptidase II
VLGREMIGVVAAALIISIDQLSKYIVLKRVVVGRSVRVGTLLRIRVAANLADKSRRRWIGHAILLTLIVAFVVYLNGAAHLFQNDLAQTGLGAAIGGAASNLFDRISRQRVIDFIDFSFWPIFNFADLAIVFGLALALLHVH